MPESSSRNISDTALAGAKHLAALKNLNSFGLSFV
jgi:hypothetical protein